MAYSFETIIASRGYHVYKETSWSDARVGDEVKVELETDKKSIEKDPYSCAIKKKHNFLHWMENRWPYSTRDLSLCVFLHQRRRGQSDRDIEISKL